MAVRTIPAELRPTGIAGRFRSRPVVVALIGLVLLAVALVAGVTVGSISIGPTDTFGVILAAGDRARSRRKLDGRHRDDRLGAADAAGPDGGPRRGRAGRRRGDLPGHRPQPARRPVRPRDVLGGGSRGGPGHPAAGRPHRLPVRPGEPVGVRRGDGGGAARLPSRWLRRSGRDDAAPADRLRGRVRSSPRC